MNLRAGVAMAGALAFCIAQAAPDAGPATQDAAPPGAAAQVAPPKRGEEYVLRLFTLSCVSLVRDPQQVVALAEAARMPPIKKPYVAMFLDGKDGAAWSASNHFGRYVLSMREDGLCAVHVRAADTWVLGRLLEETLLTSIAQRFTVASEGPVKLRDGLTYQTWVTGTGGKGERLEIGYLAARPGAPFVAVLSARLLRSAPAGGGKTLR